MARKPQDPRIVALSEIFPRARRIEYVDLSDVLEGAPAENSYVLRFGHLECVSTNKEMVHFLHSCLAPWDLIGVVHPLGVLVEEYECSAVVSIYDTIAILVALTFDYPWSYFLQPWLPAPLYGPEAPSR